MTLADWVAAVLAAPRDDAVRLAFSDWLCRNGEPVWGEYVLVQVELGAGRPEKPNPVFDPDGWAQWMTSWEYGHRLTSLEVRQKELESMPLATWRKVCEPLAGPDATGLIRWSVRRGFVCHVGAPLAALVGRLPAFVARQPLESVTPTDREPTTFSDTPAMWERDMGDVTEDWAGYVCGEDSRLPGWLFDAMSGEEGGFAFVLGKHTDRRYASPEAARADLSDALLATARAVNIFNRGLIT